MSDNKKQHMIPKTYLKNFIREEEVSEYYEKGLFVYDKNFKKKEKENSIGTNGKQIFWKSYFYNLSEECKDNPVIEKNLSLIENEFPNILSHITNKIFSQKDILFISNFTLLQLRRVEKSINSFQNSWNQINDVIQEVNRNSNFEKEVENISLKILLDFKLDNFNESNIIFEEGIHFIENNSDIDFIISDNPVVHRMFILNEIKYLFKNTNILFDENIEKEKCFIFFPLTKNFSLISTSFLISKPNKIQYIPINDNQTINKLNSLSYHNSIEKIYTSNKLSGDIKTKLITEKENFNQLKNTCQIMTKKNRFFSGIVNFNEENKVMIFEYENNNILKLLVKDNDFQSIQISFNSRGLMNKNIVFDRIDMNENKLYIKSTLPF